MYPLHVSRKIIGLKFATTYTVVVEVAFRIRDNIFITVWLRVVPSWSWGHV